MTWALDQTCAFDTADGRRHLQTHGDRSHNRGPLISRKAVRNLS